MRNQAGSIFLSVSLLLGLAVVAGLFFFFSRGSENSAVVDSRSGFQELKTRVEQAMENPAAVNTSLERNPNAFACLYSSIADCRNSGGLFVLYEGTGSSAEALSQLMKAWGVTPDGAGCKNFPSVECPLRVEAAWEPVCSPNGPCENTRSGRMKVRVSLSDGVSAGDEWYKEKLFTPTIKVTQSVSCERAGNVWTGLECLSPDQAAQRQIASGSSSPTPATVPPILPAEKNPWEVDGAQVPEVTCSDQLEIQGQFYVLEYIGPNRAFTRVPAINNCPGAMDVFVFQCQLKTPEDREGQWVQVEAQMAPNCDEFGNPMGQPLTQ